MHLLYQGIHALPLQLNLTSALLKNSINDIKAENLSMGKFNKRYQVRQS